MWWIPVEDARVAPLGTNITAGFLKIYQRIQLITDDDDDADDDDADVNDADDDVVMSTGTSTDKETETETVIKI